MNGELAVLPKIRCGDCASQSGRIVVCIPSRKIGWPARTADQFEAGRP